MNLLKVISQFAIHESARARQLRIEGIEGFWMERVHGKSQSRGLDDNERESSNEGQDTLVWDDNGK